MKRSGLLLLPLLLLAACGGAATPPPATTAKAATSTTPVKPGVTGTAQKVRSLEGITEYVLPNGMKLLLVPDGTQSTVTVNMTYFVGSLHEGNGETGMAHLLEHMTFKGTPVHHNILHLVEERGGSANGTTWNDRTNYFETLAASGDNLKWALELEADRMLNCTIAPEELATEFSVVRNEFEMGENRPEGVLEERMLSTAYLWHNYGKSTIGSRADIERVPVPALRAFYAKYYQPDNAMLVVSGKLDPAATLALVEQTFGGIAKPTRVLQAPYSVEPVQDGERTVTLRRNGDLAVVGTTYHTVAGASLDHTAIDAAASILTRKPSGRLYKALVATNLAASVDVNDHAFRDPGVATFLVEIRDPKNAPKVKEILTSVVEDFAKTKIEDAELERWRNSELKQFDQLFSQSERVAVQLSEFAALGDWRTIFSYREHLKKVTAADVTRVAKAYFKSSNRTLGEFIPSKETDRAPLTETPSVAKIVEEVKDVGGTDAGENFTATLDTLQQRLVTKDLKGGLKAAFIPKKNRGGRVKLTLALRFGDATSLAGRGTQARIMAGLLKRGTAKRGYQELRDAEDKVRSTISFRAGAGKLSVDIDSFKDQLPAAIDLVNEMLLTPSFPEKELEVIRAENLARAQQGLSDPQTLAFVELAHATTGWAKTDPRYSLSPADQIAALKAITVADLRAFHKDLLGASHGEVVAIGDVDVAAVTAKLESTLGTWASKKPYERLGDKFFGMPGGAKTVSIKDKEMATLAFKSSVQLKQDDPDYAPWLLLGQILGADTGSRIWMRVREKEGLSYGASAWTSAGSLDPVGSLMGYAIVAPKNADKALASMMDEVRTAATGKVTPAELARAKTLYVKQLETGLSDDGTVADMIEDNLFTGRSFAWQKELLGRVNAATEADLVRVAQKYLKPDAVVTVKAGTF